MGTGTSYNDTTNYTDFPISFTNKVRIVGSVNFTDNSGNYANDCYLKYITLTNFIAVTSLNAQGNGNLPFAYIAIGY